MIPQAEAGSVLQKALQARGKSSAHPPADSDARPSNRAAPSQRSESAQQSGAIPPAASEGWDGADRRAARYHADQTGRLVDKSSTSSGSRSPAATGQPSTHNPGDHARPDAKSPDVQSAQVDAAAVKDQCCPRRKRRSGTRSPCRPRTGGSTCRAPPQQSACSCGTAGAQQPTGVEGAKADFKHSRAQQVGNNVSTEGKSRRCHRKRGC